MGELLERDSLVVGGTEDGYIVASQILGEAARGKLTLLGDTQRRNTDSQVA